MGTRRGNAAPLAGVMLAVMWLAACGSESQQESSATVAAAAATPRHIIPRSVGGSSGKGPRIISSPAPLPGGKPGSQKVVLSDRTLVISSVTSQPTRNHNSVQINLKLVVRNTSGKAIRNEPAFFELIGPEGDTFGNQVSSAGFYRTIDGYGSRSGSLQFEVPAAAASSLYLLYRPEIPAETVLTRLKADKAAAP